MSISVFDLFKVGIGPSSSHTVGPMVASGLFITALKGAKAFRRVAKIQVELYGSLALTGIGHGTDKAIFMGLEGGLPATIDPSTIETRVSSILATNALLLNSEKKISFNAKEDLIFFRRKSLPLHPNGLTFTALDLKGKVLLKEVYYSTGGGFVASEETLKAARAQELVKADSPTHILPAPEPFLFHSGNELLQLCAQEKRSVAELVFANECSRRPAEQVTAYLDYIWQEMSACIDRGCQQSGILPGKLRVARRAKQIYEELTKRPELSLQDPLTILDWVNLYALAVNEENAAGSRVVTAPTNGAAGIIPAVLRYFDRFRANSNQEGIRIFLLTATAIGSLYTENASISGAEVGCQGEVGVACSMAAGALAAALGGTALQIEQAAEIGMEHNLGLTCDPIGGLVQIPCIERNAMGAVKAINAARIAMRGDGTHFVSLDMVIKTMKQTGKDMKTKYKETSRGGLAVNHPLC